MASFKRAGHQEVRAELAHHWVDLGWRPLALQQPPTVGAELSSVIQATGDVLERGLWPPL